MHRKSVTSALLLASATVGLTVLGGFQSASAQNINSFKFVDDVTRLRFNLNGTDVDTDAEADLSSLLSSSSNTLTVGWTPPPQGSYIALKYAGADDGAFGGISSGDTLRVYAIGGAFLTNQNGINATFNLAASTLTNWSGTSSSLSSNSWATDSNANYKGYSKGSPFSSPLSQIIGYTNTGTFRGKDFTGAKQYGTFQFGSVTRVDPAGPTLPGPTYLGLDVFADVYDKDGNLRSTGQGQTGRIRIDGFEGQPPNSIPEPAFYQMSSMLILSGLGALRMRKNRARK